MIRHVKSALVRVLPAKFVKHYLTPFKVGGKKKPYQAREFFDSYYRSTIGQEFSDGITISPGYNSLFARYHYSAVENSIVEGLVEAGPFEKPGILDVGPGAGHWIDFYLALFKDARLTGVEISESCAEALRQKYRDNEKVSVIVADVSRPDFSLPEKFELINAIGVIFHIVEDDKWRQAIKNLARQLDDNGLLIVGGQFGRITRDVQFHHIDKFDSWAEFDAARSKTALVNKRIRSLRMWKSCAKDAGLKIQRVIKTMSHPQIITPENNVMVLAKKR
jgi:hypothetical protein